MLPSHQRVVSWAICHRRARVAPQRIAKPLPPLTPDEIAQLVADVNAARADGVRRFEGQMQPGEYVDIAVVDKRRRIRAPRD